MIASVLFPSSFWSFVAFGVECLISGTLGERGTLENQKLDLGYLPFLRKLLHRGVNVYKVCTFRIARIQLHFRQDLRPTRETALVV
jgi:hypothetical protein